MAEDGVTGVLYNDAQGLCIGGWCRALGFDPLAADCTLCFAAKGEAMSETSSFFTSIVRKAGDLSNAGEAPTVVIETDTRYVLLSAAMQDLP
jgi:hypothetical protein